MRVRMNVVGMTAAGMLMAGLGLAAPASASVITFTFKGVVSSFTDVDNVYGFGAGANLTGDSVTDVYTIDPSTLTYSSSTLAGAPGSVFDEYNGAPTGADSVTSTIDGHSFTIDASNGDQVTAALSQKYSPNPYDQAILELQFIGLETTGTAPGTVFLFRDETVSYSATGVPLSAISPTGGYTVSATALTAAGGNWESGGVYFPYAVGATPGFFSVPGSIPEPSTWAMMFIGLGILGGGLRSARRKTRTTLCVA